MEVVDDVGLALAVRHLALEIARCPVLEAAYASTVHPCHEIARVQGPTPSAERQVPEAWAGDLAVAPILFLSSNPSISEAGDATSGEHVEVYPRAHWEDEDITTFMTRRLDPTLAAPFVVDERFRRVDGSYAPKAVRYWREARKRAGELLGRPANPGRDYVMTEIVHCKSKRERGVAKAAPTCGARYLDRLLHLSNARLLVVVGAQARLHAGPSLQLPPGFGTRASTGAQDTLVRMVGGRERVVIYLPHLTSMEKRKSFTARYGPDRLAALRAVVSGELAASALSGVC